MQAERKRKMSFSQGAQWIKFYSTCLSVEKIKGTKKRICRIPKPVPVSQSTLPISFSYFLQQAQSQRTQWPGKGQGWSFDTTLRSDWWPVISSAHGNHLDCGLKRFRPCSTHSRDGLREDLNTTRLAEKIGDCMPWGKWGHIWRTSHSYPSLISHFHVMYFNVWINRHVKQGSSWWALVSSSLLPLITPLNLSVPLASSFLTPRHLGKAGACKSGSGGNLLWADRPTFTHLTETLLALGLPLALHLTHFSQGSPPPPVLGQRHLPHLMAPELLEIGVKVGGDCGTTHMNSLITIY